MAESSPTSSMFDSLLQQVQSYTPTIESVEVGYVEEVGDGIARVRGMENIRYSELVRFANGTVGMAFNLESDNVGIIILGQYDNINEGDEVRPLGRIASVPVGMEMVGRVVNAIGEPIDGRGPVAGPDTEYYNVERIAPGVMERQNVGRPVQTGVSSLGYVEIVSGAKEGDRIVVSGSDQFGDAERVAVN